MCNMSIIKHVFGQVWQVLRQVWQVLCQVLGRFDGFDVGFGVLVLIAGSKNGSFQWSLAKIWVSTWQFAMGFGSKNDRCAASPRHLPSNAERYLYISILYVSSNCF